MMGPVDPDLKALLLLIPSNVKFQHSIFKIAPDRPKKHRDMGCEYLYTLYSVFITGCVITYDIITGWNPKQLYDQYVTAVLVSSAHFLPQQASFF